MKAWDEVLGRLGHLNKICPNPKDAEPQETPSSRKRPSSSASSNELDEISQKRRPPVQNEDQSIQFRPESEKNRQNVNTMSKTATKPCQNPSTSTRPSPVPQTRTPSMQQSNNQPSEELPYSNNYLQNLQKQQLNYQPKNIVGQKQHYQQKNNNMGQQRQ